jgi:hypothetical protein
MNKKVIPADQISFFSLVVLPDLTSLNILNSLGNYIFDSLGDLIIPASEKSNSFTK